MARDWLTTWAVLALLPACLVIDKPELSDPQPGRPQLVARLQPTTELIRWVEGDGAISLVADLHSEDAGQNVLAVGLLDYGIPNIGGDPWQDAQALETQPPGTQDIARTVRLDYTPNLARDGEGCHTLTLLVTHQRRETVPGWWCPRDHDDSAQITWFTLWCSDPDSVSCNLSNCPSSDESLQYCQDLTSGPGLAP